VHFIPIWVFFAVVATGLTHGYGQELPGLFLLVNVSMGFGVLIHVIYIRIYHHEFRNVYHYLDKYLKKGGGAKLTGAS